MDRTAPADGVDLGVNANNDEDGRRKGVDVFYMPPGVERGAAGMRVRRDYFDSRRQVRGFLGVRRGQGSARVSL